MMRSVLRFLKGVTDLRHHYGHRVRILHWCIDQIMSAALAQMDLTASQGRVMGYLAHRKEPPCARDVEEEFQLSHPTVSGILSRLEKKYFIEFRPDERDKRCKRIHVLPKGLEYDQRMHQVIRENEERIVQGFTEEEQELFASFLERAILNMGGCSCSHKQKEEDT